jgi:hypothetical protein
MVFLVKKKIRRVADFLSQESGGHDPWFRISLISNRGDLYEE